MRIAVYHNIPSGGARRVVLEHSRGLVKAGHEVVIYQPTTAESACWDLAEVGATVVRLPLEWLEAPARYGLARVAGTLSHLMRVRRNYQRLAELSKQVGALVDGGGFDLLYVHQDIYETAPSLLRYAHTPSVYFCQEPFRPLFEAEPVEVAPCDPPPDDRTLWRQAARCKPVSGYINRFRMLNERANTLAAGLVLCNSAYSAEAILRAHGRAARVCRLGVDVDFFTPSVHAVTNAQPYLLSAGAFYRHKGFRFLIRALGRVAADMRPELVLVGDRAHPEEPQVLRALAERHQVRLRMLLQVTDEELRELYRGARIFVYAPYLEPFGLAALEAMACGTPVLGVREGGLRETVRDGVTGRLVERDEELFAAALTEMLSDPVDLAQMGQQAREHVCHNWTWEQSVRYLLKLFDEFLGIKQP